MPYIEEKDREKFEDSEDVILRNTPDTAGELNYIITKIVDAYLWRNNSRPRYQDFNDVMGVLEGAKLELYRRRIAPYEEEKRESNGDVYF